jgi:hypothetical protein
MGIYDVVANDPDVRLQSSDLAAVYRNTMPDRDPKDHPFCLYASIEEYFGCHVGF